MISRTMVVNMKTLRLLCLLCCLQLSTAAASAVEVTSAMDNKTTYVLPSVWRDFCSISEDVFESVFTQKVNITHVECFVTEAYSGVWKMDDLRKSLENKTSIFSFSISCSGNSVVSLSWPIKVRNLYRMRVTDCVVKDFLGEFNNDLVRTIPDSLRELEIRRSRLSIKGENLLKILNKGNTMTNEFDCGHESTLERVVLSNIVYDFIEDFTGDKRSLTEPSNNMNASKSLIHECDFRHLRDLDESQSDSHSAYRFSLLTESASFYQLRVLNVSHSGLATLKEEFLQWPIHFPKMEMLDLSHNNISAMNKFNIPVSIPQNSITTINLQYNNISSITVDDLLWLQNMPTVLVDIRNNPVDCSCTNTTRELGNFITVNPAMKSNLSMYNYIKDIQCTSPQEMIGKTLGDLNFMCQNSENSENFPRRTGGYQLPGVWKEFCTVRDEIYESVFTPKENITHVECHITERYSGIWKMEDLRTNLEEATSHFSFSITCSGNANLSVSWPVKVRNLYRLIVKDCMVTDFLAEFNNTLVDTIPDSLRELELNSNRVIIKVGSFIDMLKNVRYISKEFECGHESTMEKLTIRNISYDFIKLDEAAMISLTRLGEQFILDSKRVQHLCDFQHLMYLDEGDSDSLSNYHLSLLTDSAIYEQLRVYNISHNHLAVLKDSVLQWSVNFPRLELLDLSHNDVSILYRFEIPVHTRPHPITTINLQYNNITSFTVKDLMWFKRMPMVLIDLRNNPIACNCTDTMKELVGFIQEEKYLKIQNLSKYSYIKDITCASPPIMKGKTLGEISQEDLPCDFGTETEYFIIPVICLSISVVVLSVILFILIKYRREVRILMYTRFHVILPCQMKEAKDSKKFDAFVSYSSNDEEWVESVFEKLEESPSQDSSARTFKFCLHHRDFIPGKTIFSNVINSVESSRHTVILISRSFLKSEFCLYEFHEAFNQSIIEQKRHLVIVMMEDIAEEELPKDLKRCIKTFTYIKKNDFLFQDRLIYALSVKDKTSADKKSRNHCSQSSTSTSAPLYSINGHANGHVNGFANGHSKSNSNGTMLNGPSVPGNGHVNGHVLGEVNVAGLNNMKTCEKNSSCHSLDTGYSSDRNSRAQVPTTSPFTLSPAHLCSEHKETPEVDVECIEILAS